MKKKMRHKCRLVDLKYNLRKGTTERLKCGTISPIDLLKGLKDYARRNSDNAHSC